MTDDSPRMSIANFDEAPDSINEHHIPEKVSEENTINTPQKVTIK